MKKLLLLFVCISFGLSESWAQYNRTETAIPESEVPELIKKIHQEKYPGAFVTSWQVKTNKAATTPNPIYVVNFKLDGRQGHKSFYTETDGFMAYIGFINQYDLPEPIQVYATQYLEDDYIKYGQIIQLEKPYIFLYRVKVNNKGQLEYFYFDKYGNKIDKKNIAPKVFSYI